MLRLALAATLLLVLAPAAMAQDGPAQPKTTAAEAIPSPEVAPRRVQVLEHIPRSEHPTLGPASAPVTIEFFFNLDKNRTARVHGWLKALHRKHPKRVRIIYRLTESREKTSRLAQSFGREAFEQGRFFEFLDAYYRGRGHFPASKDYPEVAKEAGLNFERVQRALDSLRHEEVLAANYYYWKRMRVTQVPGLLVNGRPHVRVSSSDALEEIYDAAYDEVQTMKASGVPADQISARLHAAAQREDEKRTPRFSGLLDGDPSEPPKSPQPIAMTPLLRGAHRQGPTDAPVTMVFVCHLQSLLCKTMYRQLQILRKAYSEEVQLVFHPLFDPESPSDDKAKLMHEATLCAGEQGAFWEFYQHVFDHQRRIDFDQGLAIELAASPALELDDVKFEACMETGRFAAQVEAEVQLVRKAGIQHTPALAIGGLLYYARLHFEELQVLVERELAPGLLGTWGQP